jgi:hypothetical protein
MKEGKVQNDQTTKLLTFQSLEAAQCLLDETFEE